MSASLETVVICYDIVAASDRRRVAKLLEARMVRVQQSVFEARITLVAANRMFERAAREIDAGDNLRMYVLSRPGLAKSRVARGAPLPEEGAFWLL